MARTLALVIVAGAAWVAVAAASGGGPSPGLDFGNGIVAPGGKLRYSALSDGRTTVLESVVIGTGRVKGVTYFKGSFGIPLVTFGGDTGGLSRDGQDLVLATWPGFGFGFAATRFLLVDAHTFQIRGRVRLHGSWSFDAISPDGSLMYLIHYLGPANAVYQRYEVRAFDWNKLTLYPGAIVDRREPDEKMTGIPITRVGSGDASWAYTLYSKPNGGAFVHALHTTAREAFCIDLALGLADEDLGNVRMRLRGGSLQLRFRGHTVATIDTRTFEVKR